MKNKYLIVSIICIFIIQMVNGQKLGQNEVVKLKQVLNTTIAPKFKVELKNDKAYCNIDQFSKTLDLRDNYAIAEDSLTKEAKTKLYAGRYGGPVFWKYNFQPSTNSEVVFRATKKQQLFCKISFKAQDTIVIKSQLNAFTSHNKTSDASLHTMEWTGDKYISLLLTLKKVDSEIQFELKGITLSGKFERKDTNDIAKDYTKSLRKILKREFKKLLESEEMSQLISEKFNN